MCTFFLCFTRKIIDFFLFRLVVVVVVVVENVFYLRKKRMENENTVFTHSHIMWSSEFGVCECVAKEPKYANTHQRISCDGDGDIEPYIVL